MAKVRAGDFILEPTGHFQERLEERRLAGMQAVKRLLPECQVLNPSRRVRPGDCFYLYHPLTRIAFRITNILANRWQLSTLYLEDTGRISRFERTAEKETLAAWQPRYMAGQGLRLIRVKPQPLEVIGDEYLLPVDPEDLDKGGLHFKFPEIRHTVDPTGKVRNEIISTIFEKEKFTPDKGKWELVRVDQVWYWKERP